MNRPFKKLKLETGHDRETEPGHQAEHNAGAASIKEDEFIYLEEMADVKPIQDRDKLTEGKVGPRPMLETMDDDLLVMRQLDELVHGEVPFDFADTDEYIEAATTGLDRRIVKKLKRGDYSYQAHLDLHGLNREQARLEVADFIEKNHLAGRRCVLIIHGRGMGSREGIPVLKNKLAAWLTRGAIGRRVLAFTSARPYDGGTGAVYVLLRSP